MASPALVRILHVSDFHARATLEADQRRVVEAMIADVRAEQQIRRIDVLVMSGDVAWAGKAAEYGLATKLILGPLLSTTRLAPDRVVLIPGNHDVDRDAIDPYGETGWADACKHRAGALRLMDNEAALDRATARLAGWQSFHRDFYAGVDVARTCSLGRVHHIPLGGLTLSVAALNSAWRASGDSDKGNLLIGERQLIPALTAIDHAELPLVAVHHPLDWLHSYDSDAARTEFAARGAMVLTGHEHMTDPMSVKTARGYVVYSRAGSLFASFTHTNAYTIIDLAYRDHRATFTLRTWWADRRTFDVSADVATGGTLSLDWPGEADDSPLSALRYSAVVATLTDRVEANSALADRAESQKGFDDLVVRPRFLPTPYRESTAALAVDPTQRLGRVNPIEQLQEKRILVVAGDLESGVSTALLWVLKHFFDTDAMLAPVYVSFDRHFGRTQFERAAQRWLRGYGLDASRSSLPPLAVAIDDVGAGESASLVRMTKLIQERTSDRFVLGCHEEEHRRVTRALADAGISFNSAFLAPFGHRELRELHSRLVGANRTDLVQRVTSVVGREGLPRNPFVLSALVAVLADHEDVASLNESGVLQGYVDLLLSDALPDLERLGMDKRRREHLLASLAMEFAHAETHTMARLDVETYLQEYFRGQGWLSASPGKVLESLIRRRILAVDDEDVTFRHPALFHLFQGAAYHEDDEFAAVLRSDALDNAAALRHAAGLKRDDRDLLAFTLDLLRTELDAVGAADFGVYDPDPQMMAAMLDALELELEASVPSEAEMEHQLEHFEDIQAGGGDPDDTSGEEATRRFGHAVGLLSHVLRNTELSTDLSLKQEALRAAVRGWATVGVLAVQHLETGGVSREMTGLLARGTGVNMTDEAIDNLVPIVTELMRHVLALAIAIGMASAIAGSHMEAVVENAIDDDELMGEPITAFLLTMLYSAIGRPDWPMRFQVTYRRLGDHATLATALRNWAVVQYRTTPDEREASRLESVLSQIYADAASVRGRGAEIARAQVRGEMVNRLRGLRARTQHGATSIEAKLDPLDVEDETSGR